MEPASFSERPAYMGKLVTITGVTDIVMTFCDQSHSHDPSVTTPFRGSRSRRPERSEFHATEKEEKLSRGGKKLLKLH